MHERVKLRSVDDHSSMTVFGVIIALGILAGMITLGFPMHQYFWFVVLSLALPVCLGNYIDKRAQHSDQTKQLESIGYRDLDPESLDDDLKAAIALLHPSGSKPRHIKQCVRGIRNDFKVILLEMVRTVGEDSERYAVCAVWSPISLAQCVIKRRGVFSQVKIDLKKNTHPFGNHHTLVTEDDGARELLNRLDYWFHLKHPNSRHFRMKQPQGLKESWAINGHWVVYADRGNPDHYALDQLAEFTTTFVRDLERASESTD